MSQNGIGANRPIMLLLFFISGVISIRFLPFLFPWWFFLLLASFCGVIAAKFRSAAFIACMGLGLSYAGWTAALILAETIHEELETKDVEVHGRVEGLVRAVSSGTRFEFRADSMSYADTDHPSPGTIRLTSYNPNIVPRSGERWHFVVRLKRARGMQNPGLGFNYETTLFQQRIRATGYVVSGRQVSSSDVHIDGSHWEINVNALRVNFADFLKRSIDKPALAAVLSALTVGIRSDMGKPVWELLQNTGTVHLVAISGLHIGIVSWMAAIGFSFFWRLREKWCLRIPVTAASAVFALLIALVYSFLAGFTLPTRRALCAMGLVIVALITYREIRPLGALILAMFGVLLIDPLAPFSASFWLSFMAVTVLVMSVFSSGTESLNNEGIVTKFIRISVKWTKVQLWLLIGMSPILLLGFQKISLAAPLANLVAVPLVGMAVVPLALLALIFWSCGMDQIASGLIASCIWLLEIVWAYLKWLARQPWAVFEQGNPPMWEVLLAITGIGVLFLGKALPGRWLGCFLCLPLFFSRPQIIDHGEFSFTMLDVGQGLASVVRTQSRILVYDAGAKYPSGFNLGEVVVNPYLRSIGTDKIDMLIISHNDIDHVGGAEAIVREFEVDSLVMGPSHNFLAGKVAAKCRAGQSWQWDGVRFEYLWPFHGSESDNNTSCVLQVISDTGSLLLTGDIEKKSELALVRHHGDSLDSEIMLVPHHGSKTSSSRELLEAVRPQLALVSAGYKNRFGHPHINVLVRYEELDIPVLNTADEGAISLLFSHKNMIISGHRDRAPAFWQEPGKKDFHQLEEDFNRRRNRSYDGTIEGHLDFQQ